MSILSAEEQIVIRGVYDTTYKFNKMRNSMNVFSSSGPSLGKCSPCDRTGPPNSRGPQHLVYSPTGIVLVCIFWVGPSSIVAQKAKTRVPFWLSPTPLPRSVVRLPVQSRPRESAALPPLRSCRTAGLHHRCHGGRQEAERRIGRDYRANAFSSSGSKQGRRVRERELVKLGSGQEEA